MGKLKRHNGPRQADHLSMTNKKVETRKQLEKQGVI